jgi:hypothetical protein
MSVPRDRVRIKGMSSGSFGPIVIGRIVAVLRHRAHLKAEPAIVRAWDFSRRSQMRDDR